MGELLLGLVPVVLGIAISPLAVLALVAVLVARHGRRNGPAFFIGWTLGGFLLAAGVVVYRRGQHHNDAMAAAASPADVAQAAPQLPGYLQAIENFTFVRTMASRPADQRGSLLCCQPELGDRAVREQRDPPCIQQRSGRGS